MRTDTYPIWGICGRSLTFPSPRERRAIASHTVGAWARSADDALTISPAYFRPHASAALRQADAVALDMECPARGSRHEVMCSAPHHERRGTVQSTRSAAPPTSDAVHLMVRTFLRGDLVAYLITMLIRSVDDPRTHRKPKHKRRLAFAGSFQEHGFQMGTNGFLGETQSPCHRYGISILQ